MIKKILRRTAYTILVVIGLLIGIQLFAILMINPNAYKGIVQEKAANALGRNVLISGDFNYTISLIPTITADALTVKDKHGDDFLHVSDVSVRLALLPLLKGKLALDHIKLSGVRVTVDEASDLEFTKKEKKDKTDETATEKETEIQLRLISLEDAIVQYYGEEYKIGRIALENFRLPFDNISDARIVLDDIRKNNTLLGGTLNFSMTEGFPALNGLLEVERFDILDFISDENDKAAVKKENMDTVAWLHDFDADIDVQVKTVSYGKAYLGELAMGILVDEGQLTVDIPQSSFGDGELEGRIDLANERSVPEEPVVFGFIMKGEGINYGRLSDEISGVTVLKGRADFDIELASVAPYVGKIADKLVGRIEVTGEDGRIDTGLIDLWASNLVTQMLPGLSHQTTTLNCAVARFDVRNGEARDEGILIDTSRVTIAGKAVINLAKGKIDMVLKPDSKDPSISLSTAVRIYGDINNPRVGPDVRDLASTIGSLALGVINPVALVVPLVNLGAGDDNPCVAALEQMPKDGTNNQAPKSTKEKVGKAVDGAVDKAKQLMDKFF